MKKCVLHLSMAVAVSLLTLAIAPSMHAQQQSDQDPAPTAPQKMDPSAAEQPQTNNSEAQMPASGDTTTHEAKSFSGQIVKENGALVLKDPVTKVSYKLNDPAKAKQYTGKHVKVTGKLDMASNTIEVDSIEPLP
jgi:hypothetical protein